MSTHDQRPNIVIIMTDQQRADLCRREGYSLDTTPFLDELAGRGTWFNRAYTTTPVCACARVSMLTGEAYPAVEFESICAEHGFGGLPYDGSEPLDPARDGLTVKPGQWGGYDCLNSWTQSGTMRMVRKGDWKLIVDVLGRGQLYNLKDDPGELRNRFDQPAAAGAQQDLTADLLVWMLRMQDPLPLPRANRAGRRYVMKRNPHNYGRPQTDA